ncbi:hypothetical protein CFC21_102636 [Triticum aestivum]|uniref:F-box domain-containing protein n=2 Tax=Triticum aestivum TaxID=4565 RepID=A0A9R1JP57_WHEAT|nr:uncharacterized protein LOC123094031 [Triticum aestivum]KAF7024294.1 hypothetical protein CFC21_036660 [Triticum aestivum]KAF7101254.1 hypothetical protein CFC21_102636 [Triticum aestivum]
MDLPDELLHEVLRRVPPRRLAACRRVCRNWRDAIDGRGLVLEHLAPGPLRGIFVNFSYNKRHGFFSRAATPPIDGSLGFLPNTSRAWREWNRHCNISDHCNGLILFRNGRATYVCNPWTRRWAKLPWPAAGFPHGRQHLVFDPTLSVHYRVMCFPGVPKRPSPPVYPPPAKKPRGRYSLVTWNSTYVENLPLSLRESYEQEVESMGSMEWPPYSYAVQMFSSATGQWEDRHFVRQGDAVTTVAGMWSNPQLVSGVHGRHTGVCWQGAFYIVRFDGFIMRFSLLEDKYVTIKTPTLAHKLASHTNDYGCHITPYLYLGKSKQGLYLTAHGGYELRIWIMHGVSESCHMPEWELKHQVDFKPSFSRFYTSNNTGKEVESWILDISEEGLNDRVDQGWDSGDDSIIDTEGGTGNNLQGETKKCYGVHLLGYHPYKEIIFLGNRYNGFAYYLGSSKLQYLGKLYPARDTLLIMNSDITSFTYTPCKDDLLPAQNDR